ncbi:hypothetical protein WR25_00581 [Diploscapter pachys]|uniref:Amino acid transporter transmembrane domain-containing protein n=1 Tax=Diploscapter pachys TaxID=2018661 RepID=A0A2A2JK34_9BILA|nr:hypothetical protein WR25_00581 [Diploscapter pachys]
MVGIVPSLDADSSPVKPDASSIDTKSKISSSEDGSSIPSKEDKKNTLSTLGAITTLSKSMFNAGVFSLPFAWKTGGIVVDITILFYQLGMCSIAILFISENMSHLFGHLIGGSKYHQMVIFATITLVLILITNCFTNMRLVAFFAIISSVFLIIGAIVIIQYTVRQPNQWKTLPAYTSFTEAIIMAGQLIYAFEGQTMVLPVENKVRNPDRFLAPFGVLTITFGVCSIFMTFLGFIGYTTFGDSTGVTITVNIPSDGFYNSVTICLILQSLVGNGMAMFVIFDMFQNGFRTKFGARFPRFSIGIADKLFRIFFVVITYLMVIAIPQLPVMCSLVGVTSGTLCALIYPPIFELIAFWDDWKISASTFNRCFKILRNMTAILIGCFFIVSGIYANTLELIKGSPDNNSTMFS